LEYNKFIHSESAEAVRILRVKLAAEVRILDDLNEKFTQQSMKDNVKRVRQDFEEVEDIFLGSLGKEPRTFSMEAQVIDNAERVLQLTLPKSKRLQDQFKTFGSGATLIG
jgi:hypothetical protein